jgi:hypothetical protein
LALLPSQIDYTDHDGESLRLRAYNLIRSVFPTWTDENVAAFGNILVELFTLLIADNLTFYQDAQARETFLVSATQRKNIIAAAKALGYLPATAKAATAIETFTLSAVAANNVVIPAASVVRTAEVTESVEFQLLSAVTITAGNFSNTGTVENSTNQTDVFTATGLANEEFVLTGTPFLDGSLQAVNGPYTYTVPTGNNFLSSTASDRHITYVVNQNDVVTVRGGNGVNGALFVAGDITFTYKTGGGEAGNVNAGAISKIDGSFTDVLGNPVTITVTNATAASGGEDRESNEEIRKNAPESLRTLTRTVAREDFEINARRVGGVARALMLSSNEDTGIPANNGILFIVPTGSPGALPTQPLKDEVRAQFVEVSGYPDPPYPSLLTFAFTVQDPVYLTVNVETIVYLTQSAVAATVKTAIEDALEAFFALNNEDGTVNTNVDFGFNIKDQDGDPAGEIAWSDVFNVIRDVSGVRKVDDGPLGLLLNGARQSLAIGIRQFPVLGTVKITNGATGALL